MLTRGLLRYLSTGLPTADHYRACWIPWICGSSTLTDDLLTTTPGAPNRRFCDCSRENSGHDDGPARRQPAGSTNPESTTPTDISGFAAIDQLVETHPLGRWRRDLKPRTVLAR